LYTAADIKGYRIKEDWIFDKQRSTRFVRIIGIAPLVENSQASSNPLVFAAFQNEEVRPLFWLHYASCRSWFAQWDVYNMSNDAFRGSFDDLFEMRRFSAHVVKEENVFDRKIQDYAQGLDALLEGERIKKEIFEYEHDLWNY
jgi:gliding motility associated protien GldN